MDVQDVGINAMLLHMCFEMISVVHMRSGISTSFLKPDFPSSDVQPTDRTHFQVHVTPVTTRSRVAVALRLLVILFDGVG